MNFDVGAYPREQCTVEILLDDVRVLKQGKTRRGVTATTQRDIRTARLGKND